MLGIKQAEISPLLLEVSFEGCLLNMIQFEQLPLRKTSFNNCQIQEAIFLNCNLQESIFDDCDLRDTLFQNCDLRKADFRWAQHYIIHPMENNIKGAKFRSEGLHGLLQHLDIQIEH
ncbi:pentapeptide repeat-containing protein [Persicobacter diffluens]